ncbi:MAG: hypothetical protein ABI134_18160 [Byssovorax sp.]
MITTFVSACIALAPQEWTSAGVLLVAAGLMFLNDRRLTKREKAASPAPASAVAEPPAEPAPPPSIV